MLKVENLSKSFKIHHLSGKNIEGFKNVNFELKQGSSLGISGPSGAGKSSILKCIYRTYIPSEGNLWYESEIFGKVNLATLKDHLITKIREFEIGYISQFLKVIPRVSALDIVANPLIVEGVSEKEAKERARELLLRLGIPQNLFDAYPATFSGGEQQRINIAKAIIKTPRILLLDEPTASLDSKTANTVLELFKELRMKGCTMIGIFHDIELLHKFSDEIYYLSEKEI
ncbi:MAG: phosphonate C-P lyase system protein PhnL [Brevinematales bacterium]|nr:phosphonate C-P lyase system protein PhnL [Brevinematales bacterium]